jgi:ribosome-associated protein
MLQCGETRSQHRNKAIVIERLVELLQKNLKVAKPRKKTKPSKGAIERRLKSKKENAFKKSNRKPPKIE